MIYDAHNQASYKLNSLKQLFQTYAAVKHRPGLHDAPRHVLNEIKLVLQHCNVEWAHCAMEYIRINSFSLFPELILLAMIGKLIICELMVIGYV